MLFYETTKMRSLQTPNVKSVSIVHFFLSVSKKYVPLHCLKQFKVMVYNHKNKQLGYSGCGNVPNAGTLNSVDNSLLLSFFPYV